MIKKILVFLLAIGVAITGIGLFLGSKGNLKGPLLVLLGFFIVIPCVLILLFRWVYSKMFKVSKRVISEAVLESQESKIHITQPSNAEDSPSLSEPNQIQGVITGEDLSGVCFVSFNPHGEIFTIKGDLLPGNGYAFTKEDIFSCSILFTNNEMTKYRIVFNNGKQGIISFHNKQFSNGVYDIEYWEAIVCDKLFDATVFPEPHLHTESHDKKNTFVSTSENTRITGIYNKAVSAMKSANSETEYKTASEIFKTISGFKDADELAEQCLESAEVCRKNAIYTSAESKMKSNAINDYEAAIQLFSKIFDWRDAEEKIIVCRKKIEEIKDREEVDRFECERQAEERRIKEEADRSELERQAEERRISEEKAEKRRKKVLAIITMVLLACGVLIVVFTTIIIPKIKMNRVKELLNSGDYEAAYALLEEIGNSEAITSSKYDRAVSLIKTGDYEAAYMLLEGLNYKDSAEILSSIKPQYRKLLLSKAQVGSYVFFGAYEQDNNTSNGKEDIEWLVLAKGDNRILVISKNALDCQQYNTSYDRVTWESCSLRMWLNESFISEAFNSEEQNYIISSIVSNENNPYYSSPGGNSTTDKVFLLSIAEANQYFSSDEKRQCQVTEYCYAQGAYNDLNGNYRWWLRSPGSSDHYKAVVNRDGSISYYGLNSNVAFIVVRPVLWINLEP